MPLETMANLHGSQGWMLYCSRKDLNYIHFHCLCWKCKGKAVSHPMKHRHHNLAIMPTMHAKPLYLHLSKKTKELEKEPDNDLLSSWDNCMEVIISPPPSITSTVNHWKFIVLFVHL